MAGDWLICMRNCLKGPFEMDLYADSSVVHFEEDGRCVMNVSENFVVLARPEEIDLKVLFTEFECRCRAELRSLLTMQYGSAVERYGLLGFNEAFSEERRQTPVGLLLQGAGTKLAVFQDRAVVTALINLKMIPATTPHGRPRTRYPRESGAMGEMLCGLPYERQRQVIDEILSADLDGVLRTNQRDEIAMTELRRTVHGRLPTAKILTQLADWMDQQVAPPDRSSDAFHGKGSGKLFAPIWFGQFLASKGIWLLPLRYFDRLLAFYPDHLRPLLPIMSVPAHSRDIADSVIASAPKTKTSLKQATSAFVMAALASTMWSERRFCPAPLLHMKLLYGTENVGRSASINHIYKVLSDSFEVDVRSRGEARLLNGRKRVESAIAFRWVDHPNKANTRKISRILRWAAPPTTIPDHTRALAEEMRGLLCTFKVQNMKAVEDALNLFLVYTLVLKPVEAPLRLRDIRTEDHVRSLASPHETYWQFLNERCPDSNAKTSTMSKMREIWHAASIRDGFATSLECPFDPRRDRFGTDSRERGRAGRALEQIVIDTLIEINRENDYAFARGVERFHYVVRNAEGGYEKVFWPAVAIALEITLRTGLRLRSARWLDSGEGDEEWYDPVAMNHRPNALPCKIPGRQQFFVRKIVLDDARRTEVNGMFVNVAKGGPYQSPYFPEELVSVVCRMRELQIRYNSMGKPIPAIDDKHRRPNTDPDLFAEVFPLLRTPDKLSATISEDMVRSYYKSLLIYAQPIIEVKLGRSYPLVDVDLDLVLTTIHDHRRSFVTNGEEVGVPISVLRIQVGQKSNAETNRYNRVRDHRVHTKVQQATYDRDLMEALAQDDPKAFEEMVMQVAATSGENSLVVRRLREMAERSGPALLDMFLHCLCVAGDCETGGRVVRGTRQAVWRPRACAGCIFRASGWAHRAGIVTRTRILTIELRLAAKQGEELNRKVEEAEAHGRTAHALRRTQDAAEYLYRNLANELRLEREWLRKVDAAARAARAAGRTPSSIVLANGVFELEKVETSSIQIHDFELLQSVLKDVIFIPAGILELPPSVPMEFERQVRQILRANMQEDVLYRIPEAQKLDSLVAIGDLFLDAFGDPDDFQRLVEASEKGIPDEAIIHMAAVIRRAADDPKMIGAR